MTTEQEITQRQIDLLFGRIFATKDGKLLLDYATQHTLYGCDLAREVSERLLRCRRFWGDADRLNDM